MQIAHRQDALRMQEPNRWPVLRHEQEVHAMIGQAFARAKCAGRPGFLGADVTSRAQRQSSRHAHA